MSIMGHRTPVTAIAGAALAMLMVALIPVMTEPRPAREIALVARGMAFYLEQDGTTANPPLRLVAGERVRIVLRNDDRGMTHDLAVPGLPISLDGITWGERRELTIVVPDQPGSYEYICRPHGVMMHGRVSIARQGP